MRDRSEEVKSFVQNHMASERKKQGVSHLPAVFRDPCPCGGAGTAPDLNCWQGAGSSQLQGETSVSFRRKNHVQLPLLCTLPGCSAGVALRGAVVDPVLQDWRGKEAQMTPGP